MDGSPMAEATALAALLKKHGWLAQTWLTNFCVDDTFAQLALGTQAALLALSDEELQRLPVDLPVDDNWSDELRELVCAARSVAPPKSALRDDGKLSMSSFLFRGIAHARNMGPKKQHEVVRLAPLIAETAHRCGATTVVDLGSGQGYLSHVLAFHFGLHVVGLEALEGNVGAAHHRAWMVREKLRNPKFRVADPGKGGATGGAGKVAAAVAALPHVRNAAASGGSEKAAAAAAAAAAATEGLAASTAAAEAAAARGDPSPLIAHKGGSFSNAVVRLHPECTLGWLEEALRPSIAQIDEAIISGESDSPAQDGKAGLEAKHSHESSIDKPHQRFLLVGLHACGDLTPTLLRLAADAVAATAAGSAASPADGTPPPPTTTSSAPPARPLQPRCVGVVSVGCCYHRVSEPLAGESRPQLAVAGVEGGAASDEVTRGFLADGKTPTPAPIAPNRAGRANDADGSGNGLRDDDEGGDGEAGALSNFPMSAHVRSLGVTLGEIALHLSLQAVWRWPAPLTSVEETKGRCRHFLYRCVLEARLRELRDPGVRAEGLKLPRDGNVGSLPICHTFGEYAELALPRLGIEYGDAEAARMAQLWERYGAPFERKMHCFVMLRGVLSRIIERVITLDRLIFMREAGLGDAYAEEIFDPRLSPRSMAIVAAWTANRPADASGAAGKCATCAPVDELGELELASGP